jgi:hypothetical protein
LIDTLYKRLRQVTKSGHYVPLTREDLDILFKFNGTLISTKAKKLTDLKFEAALKAHSHLNTEVDAFRNLSDDVFTSEELTTLRKGPLFAPQSGPLRDKELVIADAKVDAALSKLPVELEKRNIVEFAAATKRILRSTSKHGVSEDLKVIKAIRRRDLIFLTSDKSRRMIALSHGRYLTLMDEHKSNLIGTKLLLPSSTQAKFNKDLTRIASKYSDPLKKCLLGGLCCEPVPSKMRCLPKDHKPGELRGRPIVASVDAPATKLSIILAGIFQPMITRSIEAHLISSSHFIDTIRDVHLHEKDRFASFDVVNLYGSIPIEDSLFPGLLSIVTEFVFDNKDGTILSTISKDDLVKIIRLAVTSDTVEVANSFFRQKTGIQMGNNASVACATIFMNFIEKQILKEAGDFIKLWVRYIDDVFCIYRDISSDALLEICNDIYPEISFTVECASPSLPFLDLLLEREGDNLSYSLYSKQSHSNHTIPWNSTHARSILVNSLTNEFRRAISHGSNPSKKKDGILLIKDRYAANGYPMKIVNRCLRKLSFCPRRLTNPKELSSLFPLPRSNRRERSEARFGSVA